MIDKNCRGTVASVYILFVVIDTLLILFVKIPWVVYPFIGASIWACVWQTYFHSIPNRKTKGDSHNVCSVADGRVLIIEKVFEKEYLNRECLQVSVYMNFFDVHCNFWPIDAKVLYANHIQGKHFYANNPKSSIENEHTCTLIENCEGTQVFFKQIAGGFARRIVSYAKTGSEVKAGEQCGIIKFGSRIDMFLPLNAEILVKEGDLVRGSESIIARI